MKIVRTKMNVILTTLKKRVTDERKCKYHSYKTDKQMSTLIFQLMLSMQVSAKALRLHGHSSGKMDGDGRETEGAAQSGLVACERVQELCRCYDHRSVSCSPNGGQIQPEVCTQEKAVSRINSRSVHMVVPVCPNSTLLVSRTILTSMIVQCCGTGHRECFKCSLHFKFQRCPCVCSDCSTSSVHVIKVFLVGTCPDCDGTEHTDASEQELHHQ